MEVKTKAGRAGLPDMAEVMFKSTYNCGYVYPSLADGVSLVSGASAWGEGSWTEVIPVDTVNVVFRVLGLVVESTDYDGVFEIALGTGEPGSEEELCRKRFSLGKFATGKYMLGNEIDIKSELLEPGSRIVAKLACEQASKNITISLAYNKY